MNRTCPFVVAASLMLSGQIASAQDLSRYRVYALESSLDSVIAATRARAADAKTLHERPATIQQLEWRAPYAGSRDAPADPVRDIAFSFYNDALYRVAVRYDRDRTAGLTDEEIIDFIAATYGPPVLASGRIATGVIAEAVSGGVVLARWESAESLLTLVRGTYAPDFHLTLVSKSLSTSASSAIEEATRLDAAEAPRRAAEQRSREADDASAARDKTRTANKGAFRP